MQPRSYMGLVVLPEQVCSLVSDEDGRELARFQAENDHDGSTVDRLKSAIKPCLEALDSDTPLTVMVGLPGLESAAMREAAARLLDTLFPASTRLLLGHSLEAVVAGGVGNQPGTVFYSGLGAGVARVDERGEFRKAEPVADPLGQEGSGTWIGTRTIKVAAYMMDGKIAHEERLIGAIEDHFQTDVGTLLTNLVQGRLGPRQVCSLAQVTMKLALYPKPIASCRALILQACRSLRNLADELGQASLPVTYHGSSLSSVIRDELSSYPWQEPLSSPVEGAVRLARAGQTVADDLPAEGVAHLNPWIWTQALNLHA